MTKLVEEIVIRLRICHCDSKEPSTVLGGTRNMHDEAGEWLKANVPSWLKARVFEQEFEADGFEIDFENTGLQEVHEEGDN